MTGLPGWLIPPKTHVGPPYTEQQLEKIFNWLSKGRTLTSLVRANPEMPDPGELMRFLHQNPPLLDQYHKARAIGVDLTMDETMDHLNDDADSPEDLERTKQRIGHTRWLASMYNPKRYGERKQIDINNKVDISAALQIAEERVKSTLIEHDTGEVVE